jgi:hypothetical protein
MEESAKSESRSALCDLWVVVKKGRGRFDTHYDLITFVYVRLRQYN